MAAAVAVAGFAGSSVFAEGMAIGVSWASFQEERWKIDEAAMVAAIEAAGNTYVSADAESSSAKQLRHSTSESFTTWGILSTTFSGLVREAAGNASTYPSKPPLLKFRRGLVTNETERTLCDMGQGE